MKYQRFNKFYNQIKSKAQIISQLEKALSPSEIKQFIDRIPENTPTTVIVHLRVDFFVNSLERNYPTTIQWLLGDGEVAPQFDFSLGVTQVVLKECNQKIEIHVLPAKNSDPQVEPRVQQTTVEYDLDRDLQQSEREVMRKSNPNTSGSPGGGGGGGCCGGSAGGVFF